MNTQLILHITQIYDFYLFSNKIIFTIFYIYIYIVYTYHETFYVLMNYYAEAVQSLIIYNYNAVCLLRRNLK